MFGGELQHGGLSGDLFYVEIKSGARAARAFRVRPFVRNAQQQQGGFAPMRRRTFPFGSVSSSLVLPKEADIHPQDMTTLRLLPRKGCGVTAIGQRVFVFGGATLTGPTADLLEYDFGEGWSIALHNFF